MAKAHSEEKTFTQQVKVCRKLKKVLVIRLAVT
jgi:hypothetical protein